MTDIFIEKTNSVLMDFEIDRIAPRSFEISQEDNKEEQCVLIMGLNPAGDKEDAKRERENIDRTYFFSTEYDIKSDWIYNKYFRPIFTFVDKTVEGAKWPWCNIDWNTLEKEICSYADTKPYLKEFKSHYEKHKAYEHTIYIGDMFYYHETNSKKLPLRKDIDYRTYCQEMLMLHIETLRKHNKKIKYIYINNAKVSHWLRSTKYATLDTIDGINVFYGAMLSGMRCLDDFSRLRLINEIREKL